MQEDNRPSDGQEPLGPLAQVERDRQLLVLMYALMGLGLFVPLTAIVSVIMAHIKRGQLADPVLETHASWLIRTFWWSLLWGFVGTVLTMVIVGYLVLVVVWIWVAYRVVKGGLQLWDGLAV